MVKAMKQGHLGEHVQALHRLHGGEAQAADVQRAQAEGAQQQPRHQIGGDSGQLQPLGCPGQQQSADQSGGKADKNFHCSLPLSQYTICAI